LFCLSGELPSDELLQEVQQALTPWAPKQTIPQDLRDALNQFVQPSVSAMADAGVLAVLNQAVHSFEQIPKLVDEVRYYILKWATGLRALC
jgi:hypothetical protein